MASQTKQQLEVEGATAVSVSSSTDAQTIDIVSSPSVSSQQQQQQQQSPPRYDTEGE